MFNSTDLDELLNSIIDISANTTTIDVVELSDSFYANNSADIYDARNTDTFTLFSTKAADVSTSTATSTPTDAVTSENAHVPQVMAEYDTSTFEVDDVSQCRAIAVSANDILYDDFEYG